MKDLNEINRQIELMQESLTALIQQKETIIKKEKENKKQKQKPQQKTDSPQIQQVKLIGISGLARAFGCSEKTIRRMHNAGRLPTPFRLPGSSVWKWKESDILKFINEQ